MFNYKVFFRKFWNLVLDHPLLSAILIVDFVFLLFHRPPVLFSLPMMLGLVAMAMYFAREITKLEFYSASSDA